MVLTPDQRVVAINKEGRSHFQTDQGRFARWNWLKSEALAEYNAFAKSVNEGANKRYGIARITLNDQQESLIEFFPLDGRSGQGRNIVVRALKLIWIEQMDSMLSEAFGLTAAEIEICRLLFEGKKTSEIAGLRTTTKRTTGYQLSAIFAKTETDSQLNLVRLLARLASRSKVERITAPSDWSDPFERETSFFDADGNRLAYTWMGHPAGTPALLIHGAVNGYLYPPEFEHALVARRIKLFALHRPGCGNSDRIKKLDLCDDIERAVRAFVAHLGLKSLPVIALCAAVIPAMRLSCMVDSPVSAILACGPFFPFTKARFSRMAGKSRTMVWAACNAPWISTVLARIGYRQVLKHGVDWYLEQSFELLPFDKQTAFDPEILPLMRNAAAFTFRQGAEALFEEWTMRNRDASLAAPAMSVPMHWLLGAVHIYKGLTAGKSLIRWQKSTIFSRSTRLSASNASPMRVN